MPRRRTTSRQQHRRLNDAIIAELHELIRQGLPWDTETRFKNVERGLSELKGLVSGYFFFCTLVKDDPHGNDEDLELKRAIYESVKSEFISAHAHYRPGSRPWAFWQWDHCLMVRERHHGDEEPDRHQLEYEFLEHFDLLTSEEKEIFAKYASMINVNIASGDYGRCALCWELARETAKKIDFDLEASVQRYEFWIPGDLYNQCEHLFGSISEGIFRDAD